jgi:hypothetical protein
MVKSTPSQYAPIFIPTLCRYTHFKNCVESLINNTGAEKTDLFVALDYPLKKEHWKGYKEICKYIEKLTGFKSITIFKRNVNFGEVKNIAESREIIFKKYDRIIFSEDDNVFSPNFLEYINKGLDKFENDKSVLAICGINTYKKLPDIGNNFFRQNSHFVAWGYGTWKDRMVTYDEVFTQKYRIKKLLNPITFSKVLRSDGSHLLFLILSSIKDLPTSDSMMSLYMFLQNKSVIHPIINKVRNMGFDGSGIHCSINDFFAKQEIDNNIDFEYIGKENVNYTKEIRKEAVERKICYISRKQAFKLLFVIIYKRAKNIIKK